MTNRHGTPIWYELMTLDPEASKAFYEAVPGWKIGAPVSDDFDYRMIETGDGAVGGMMALDDAMSAGGAQPGWHFYLAADDVDATAEAVKAAGGSVLRGPWTAPGVGRMVLAADPQGIVFYAMRGESDADSTVWDRTGMGKCNWNELITSDQAGALDFYGKVFGWSFPERMPMGPMGDYIFIHVGDTAIGAIMQRPADAPPADWRFYFRAPDIEAAAKTVTDKGGSVLHGPMTVPGGDRVILASDPAGVLFGVVGPGNGEEQ